MTTTSTSRPRQDPRRPDLAHCHARPSALPYRVVAPSASMHHSVVVTHCMHITLKVPLSSSSLLSAEPSAVNQRLRGWVQTHLLSSCRGLVKRAMLAAERRHLSFLRASPGGGVATPATPGRGWRCASSIGAGLPVRRPRIGWFRVLNASSPLGSPRLSGRRSRNPDRSGTRLTMRALPQLRFFFFLSPSLSGSRELIRISRHLVHSNSFHSLLRLIPFLCAGIRLSFGCGGRLSPTSFCPT